MKTKNASRRFNVESFLQLRDRREAHLDLQKNQKAFARDNHVGRRGGGRPWSDIRSAPSSDRISALRWTVAMGQ